MLILDSTEIKHIKLPTTNLQKTMKFYIYWGFETILRTFNKEVNEQMAFLQFKDIVIETNENLNTVKNASSINHISINIFDINKAFKSYKRRNYNFLNDEVKYLSFWGNGVSFLY
jgi:lactoylglutathione lyase